MKQFLFLTLLFLLVTSTGNGQSTLDQGQSGGSSGKKSSEAADKKYNILKLNLTSLVYRNYSFQYERVVSRKISIGLGVRFMPEGGVPLKNSVLQLTNGDPDAEEMITSLRLKNFAFTPELRLYLSKKGYGKGFYLAPYYRYATFNASGVSVDYQNSSNTTSTIKLEGDVTTHSGGLMLGSQWFIGKSVTLDWWILGAHYGKGNGTFTGTTSLPLTTAEQAEIRDQITGVELPAGSLKAEVTANTVKAIIDGPWAGIRAGLSLGIRF
jgi:hypothetical protein